MSEQDQSQGERSEQARSRATKAAIINAAVTEFAHFGFDGATTRGIATRADVNPALIAHHFGSKDALWRAVAEHLLGTAADRFRTRWMGLEGVDQETRLRLMLKEFILLSADVPELNRFMMQANTGSPERMHWLVDRFLRPGGVMIADIIDQAQKAQLIAEGDPMHLRFLFATAAASIFSYANEFEALTGKKPQDPDVIDRHVDMVLGIFKRRD